jgi:antitoxin YefM
MKRPALAEDLVPVNEFRSNMATWLKKLSADGRPVVLTQRGRATAVLIEPSALDRLEESQELVRKVAQGMEDAAAGKVFSTEELKADLLAVIERATRTV